MCRACSRRTSPAPSCSLARARLPGRRRTTGARGTAGALPTGRAFRGRVEHRNPQYAIYATACIRGGLQPDVLSDAGWWQTPLWQYAVFAVVIYSRAAAERPAVPVAEIDRRIAA